MKPYYRQLCKRPGFHDEYLASYNLPNVTLVDTQDPCVERITEKNVMINGVEYKKANGEGFFSGQYGGGAPGFFKILDDWRADG